MRDKTWGFMKEIPGKCKTTSSNLPTKITVNKTDIFGRKKVADEFNKRFTNIGTDLENETSNVLNPFDSHITKVNTNIESHHYQAMNFFSLKINKNPGNDSVSFNVTKYVLVSYVNLWSIYLTFRLLQEFFLMTWRFRRLLRYVKLTTAVILVIIGQYLCYRKYSKNTNYQIFLFLKY